MTATPVRVDANLLDELASIVGDRLSTAMVVREQHGPALDVMRAVKHALDPDNIMNSGKVIPA